MSLFKTLASSNNTQEIAINIISCDIIIISCHVSELEIKRKDVIYFDYDCSNNNNCFEYLYIFLCRSDFSVALEYYYAASLQV
ncbi:MAG TPA: hypothetical protein VFD03_00540 [Clostridia bacterium]|nr:hypothetical protein [Clostridia bacterium]